MRKFALLLAALLLATTAWAQPGPPRSRASRTMTVRAASGALGAGETAAGVGTGSWAEASLVVKFTTLTLPDADDELDVFIQTTYDDGTTWCDMENIHFTNADNGSTPTLRVLLGPIAVVTTDTAVACTDAGLADDTKLKLGIGSELRMRIVDTDPTGDDVAYNYSVLGFFR